MLNRYHPAVAVPDDHRVGEAAPGHPARRDPVVLERFVNGLKCRPLRRPAVADAEDVAPPPVERQAREAELGEHRRQEARCAHVEVHRVAVEQQHRAARRAVGLVPRPVERHATDDVQPLAVATFFGTNHAQWPFTER